MIVYHVLAFDDERLKPKPLVKTYDHIKPAFDFVHNIKTLYDNVFVLEEEIQERIPATSYTSFRCSCNKLNLGFFVYGLTYPCEQCGARWKNQNDYYVREWREDEISEK